MSDFLWGEGVIHKTTAPYHPSSNGEAERFVRTLKEGLKKLLDEGNNLKMAQFILLQEYRASPSTVLNGNSPAQMFLRRELRTEMDRLKMPPKERPEDGGPQAERQERHSAVDEGRPSNRIRKRKSFEGGDSVWVQNLGERNRWTPAVLLEPIGERMWRMEMEGGGERVAHLDQIKERRLPTRQ
uniref:Integrase catalytic domain-containing protein n=1 Tax=Globodera rostochiensis TaxID=31243 RepID=A0A914GR91_GLORO